MESSIDLYPPEPFGRTLRSARERFKLERIPKADIIECESGLFAYCPRCNVDKWGFDEGARPTLHTCSNCNTQYLTFEKPK